MDKADAMIIMPNIKRSKPVFKVKSDKLASFIFLADRIKRTLISCRKSDDNG